MLQLVLEDSGQVGESEFEIFKLKIRNLNDYGKNLIHTKNTWYNTKLL